MNSNGKGQTQLTTSKTAIIAVWVILIAFTITGYFSSEEWFSGRSLATVLMLLTAVKFIGVSFWFMEIKHSHSAWKWALLSVFLLFSLLIVFTIG